ncbi:MAG: DUF4157 domain-containing protein [Chloroflexi bacterium]|nr:DUF4157 domain-containing protein [Chloroflexota bacterium]
MTQTKAVKQRTAQAPPQKRRTAQTANTHERQARAASVRLLHGEADVSRMLTHAPAARRADVRHSRSVPLPQDARAWLERGFDADLSAVRVHTDAAAAEFAAREDARAIAAGRDIYFADGQYQPGTATGRMLLAHEVAHVLQQTARLVDGHLIATDAVGSGELQYDKPWPETHAHYSTEAASQSSAVQTSVAAMIREIERVVGREAILSHTLGAGVETGGVNNMTAFEQRVTNGDFNAYEPLARSLLFDVLKLLGRFDGAAYLLTQDSTLTTAAPDVAFWEHVRDSETLGNDWFYGMFSRIPDINRLFPDRYLEAIWRYLMNPARNPIASSDVRTLTTDFLTAYRSAAAAGQTVQNERVLGAYSYLGSLNDDLQAILGVIDGRTTGLPVAMGRTAAANEWRRIATTSFANHERRAFRELGPLIVPIAERAAEYWDRVAVLYQDTLGDAETQFYGSRAVPHSRPPTPDPSAAPPTTPGTLATTTATAASTATPQASAEALRDSAFSAFVRTASERLTQVLRVDSDAMPTPSAYQADLTRLREALSASRSALGERMFTVFRRRDMADASHFDTAVWLGVAQAVIDGLLGAIGRYDSQRDIDYVTNFGRDDLRMYNRYEIAWHANVLARIANNTALLATSDAVRQGADLNRSYLLLIGEWREDTSPPRSGSYLGMDMSGGAVVRGSGLTANQLDRLFYLTNQQALNAILFQMLREPEGTTEASYGTIQRALRQTREQAPMPKRWTMRPYLIVWNDTDRGVPERADMAAMMENHPRFDELLDMEDHRRARYITPLERTTKMYVWFLPEFERVTRYLMTVPGLGDQIRAELGTTPTPENLLELLNRLWQRSVAEGHTEGDREAFTGVQTDITDAIGRDITSVEQMRDLLFRYATTRDRRVTAALVNPLLTRYAGDASVTNYVVPNRVIEYLDRFNQDIRPDNLTERRLQMHALILSIAPNLRAAFVRQGRIDAVLGIEILERRFDIISGLYGYAKRALEFASAADAADQLRPVLHSTEDGAALVAEANREHLQVLINRWDRVIGEVQRQTGFSTTPNRTGIMRVGSPRELGLNSPFLLDGERVQITAIHTDFRFHPSYGHRGDDFYHPSILTHLNGSRLAADQPLLTYEYLERDGSVTLTASTDEQELAAFSHVVTMELIVRGLEQLAEYIRIYVEVGVDAASLFIPGAPAAITVAQLVQFLIMELPHIQEEILNDPLALVRELETFISPALRDQVIENIWMWVLLRGDLPFAERLQARTSRAARSTRPTPRPATGMRGRFQRIAAFARTVIERILNAFLNLRQRVRMGFTHARRVALRYPLLRRLLSALPVYIETAEFIAGPGSEAFSEMVSDLTVDGGFPSINTSFREALDQIFEGLNGLEVPFNILPMDIVVDVILERFLATIRGPRGFVLRRFLELTQLRPILSAHIAQTLRDEGLDPNVLWRETIRGDLQRVLEESRTGLIAGINNLLRSVLGSGLQIPTAGMNPITVAEDTSLPDMSPLRRDRLKTGEVEEEEAAPNSPPHIRPAEGRPLPDAERERYETLFGHDFSHVRVHSGREADQLTRYHNAYALTSGSHIFLGRDVPPGSARTEPVMRHELAHVLQQTGSRPTKLPDHDREPSLGMPGRGLSRDARREAAANRMVLQAARRGSEAVEVEEEGGAGLLPAVSPNTAKAVTGEMGRNDVMDSLIQQVHSLATIPGGGGRGFRAAVTAAEHLWAAIRGFLMRRTPIGTGGGRRNADPFETSDALNAIAQFFGGSRTVEENMRALTYMSKRDKADGSVELDRRKFLSLMNEYLHARTGVDLDIDHPPLTTTDDMPWTPQYATVRMINLGRVRGNANLYTKMQQNTDAYMGATKFSRDDWKIIGDELEGEDLPSAVWDSTDYRLSQALIDYMREHIRTRGTADVEVWTDYVNHASTSAPMGGLRVATHGQLTGSGARPGRQSHHVPQFLLVEYFEAASAQPTSRVSKRVGGSTMFPPGFNVTGSNATHFEGGGHRIDFNTLDPNSGRGDGIPAVSLAAKTHQRGRLHLNAGSDWGTITRADAATTEHTESSVEFTGTMAQGIRMDLTFYLSFLKPRLETAGMRRGITDRDDILTEANRHASNPAYLTATYEAIRDTYRWMYNGMMSSLRLALNNEALEVLEYQKSARKTLNLGEDASLPANYTPHITHTAAVVSAVETKNAQIMSQWRR